MVPEFSNSTSLLQYAASSQLYSKLVKQINKDFHTAHAPLNIPLPVDPDTLWASIKEKIYYLLLEQFSTFLQLMYVVDIPETIYREIQSQDVVEIAETISFLVLKREWQKVWLKTNYRP